MANFIAPAAAAAAPFQFDEREVKPKEIFAFHRGTTCDMPNVL